MTVMMTIKSEGQEVKITETRVKTALERLDNELKKQFNYSGSYDLSTAQLKTLLERKIISIDAYVWFCLMMGNRGNESIADINLDDFIAEHQVHLGKEGKEKPVLDRNQVMRSFLALDKKEAFQLQSIAAV